MRLLVQLLVAALTYTRSGNAQEGDKYKVKGNSDVQNQTTPHVREGDHIVHFVTVGKATNNFYPNSIVASPGDVVMFQFYPLNHSVIKAAYGFPCIPYEDVEHSGRGFFSGFMPVSKWPDNPPSWNLTINDTQPIFYYCGAKGSCIDWGMVGGINLNASTPLSNQIGLAREADYMLLPGQGFPNEAQQASMALLAATATTATFTVTATSAQPSSSDNGNWNHGQNNDYGDSNEHTGLSSGATAGIAVGSAVGALAAAGLVFLLLRTRKLKRKLDAQRAADQMRPDPRLQSSPGAYAQVGNWPGQQRQMSQLPPYNYETEMYKPPGSDRYSDVPSRTMSPQQSPYNVQGQQFMAFQPQNPNHRYTTQSELTGSVGPMSELDASHQDLSNRRSGYS